MTTERRALVVTTDAAAGPRSNGATLRAEEIIELLERSGHAVFRTTREQLPNERFDLGVAVSYACAGYVRGLQARAARVWLDACDSWLLVDASGLRSGQPSYGLRALRDGARLLTMPRVDLLTYISAADRRADRGTVRSRRALVLPGRAEAPVVKPRPEGARRRLVLAGDWSYPPNRDGLLWFDAHVLPLIERDLGPAWEVVVLGADPPPTRPSVRRAGYVEAAELFQEGDVHLAPIRFGGGVKRKVLTPLLAGLPVVTTPAGAHGLAAADLLDVTGSIVTFAAAVVRRLGEPPHRPATRITSATQAPYTEVRAWLDRRTAPTSSRLDLA